MCYTLNSYYFKDNSFLFIPQNKEILFSSFLAFYPS